MLDGLARKLEAKGIPFRAVGQAMRVELGADWATFTVREQTRREEHLPTPQELAAEERRQRRLQRRWQLPRAWDDDRVGLFERAYPEFDAVYTGMLVLQAEGFADGVRRKWADGKRQRIERLLDDIVLGLEALLAVRKARREERDERERQWQERLRRRELARRRAEREEKRSQYLAGVLALNDQIRRLRQWLSETEQAMGTMPGSDLGRMVGWAMQRLTNLQAKADPAEIDRDLAGLKLLPDLDELLDPDGEPPDGHFWPS